MEQNEEDEPQTPPSPTPGAAKPVQPLIPEVKFDPEDFEGLPKGREENPHLQYTKRGQALETTAVTSVAYSQEAIYERPFVPFSTLLLNMEESVAKEIRADPARFVAAVNLGVGPALEREIKDIREQLVEFLTKLGLEFGLVEDEINTMVDSIIEPTRATTANVSPRFDKPWPRTLEIPNASLRRFLTWHGVFDVSPTFVVMFLEYKDTPEQWFLTDVRYPALRDTAKSYKETLAAIKKKLWESTDFRNVVRDATVGKANSIMQRMKDVLDTFDLIFTTFQEAGKPQRTNVYKLVCKPFINGTNEELQLRLLSIVRNAGVLNKADLLRGNAGAKAGYGLSRASRERYMIGLHAASTQRAFAPCDWCKAIRHPTQECTYLTTPGWRGPKQENLPAGARNEDEQPSHAAERAS
ncbi:hypothetical protein FISHEDRAFT_74059 [Fistulina hepatica ATCC 64428]|uniref:Uncharacterized protein n=1 Tax=Fistulina hepatica ATCC 64428 TaxID=1128425 RepID=A0A0D7AAI6_9AGAR|nr:hypothetical protein FISHEDRAFT_74059 [Fistulina hepatica ATCC 64428]